MSSTTNGRGTSLIVGTAGHVDHGKTALVRALTGIDTDRLKVERERGITTELGFATLALEDHRVVSLVDVPGHERFVSSMAAGAGGVDVALLVVAVDEGVMPQTREHVDICALLGVRAAVIVLTKMDAEAARAPGRFEAVEADLRGLAQGTIFASAPAVRVSARTGLGIEALRHEITVAVAKLPAVATDGLLYLGLDRAFTLKGFGTVVTGTVHSGRLAREEEVVLLPSALGPCRVRGLQHQGRAVEEVAAGDRAAVNLAGVEVSDVSRGMVLGRPGAFSLSSRVDVELRCLRSVPQPLGPRDAFICHVGTASAACRLSLLGAKSLAPGATGVAQLVLAQPLPLLAGQRFLLRGFRAVEGHGHTVAGGVVLQVAAPRRRPSAPHRLVELGFDDLPRRIATLVEEAGGLTRGQLLARVGVGASATDQALQALGAKGKLVSRGEQLVEATTLALALPIDPLAAKAEPLADAWAPLEAAVLAQLQRGNLAPPTTAELAVRLRVPTGGAAQVEAALSVLCRRGAAVRAADGLFFAAESLQALRGKLVDYLKQHQSISVADFKVLTGASRRFTIPLSELFDKERLTLRVGDRRVLREHAGERRR